MDLLKQRHMPLLCCEEGEPLAALVPNLLKHSIKLACLFSGWGTQKKQPWRRARAGALEKLWCTTPDPKRLRCRHKSHLILIWQ